MYIYLNFFIHLSVKGYIGCFTVLAIVNSAAVNNGIPVSFSIFVSSGYMPRSEIAGSYGGFTKKANMNKHIRESIYITVVTLAPVLLPGKSYGQRSLVGYSPWGHEASDMTERLHFHFSLSCIGEGNGSPLQCSCLENPRDGGAWWAAVYGVGQSRTRLRRLSSSSNPGKLRYTEES